MNSLNQEIRGLMMKLEDIEMQLVGGNKELRRTSDESRMIE